MTAADRNLAALLAGRVRTDPDAIALRAVVRGRDLAVSFAELADRSARGAALLHARGLRAGDRVLVFQPVSLELYEVLLAIFRLGLTAMFADPSAGMTYLARCCALGSPRAFIGPGRAHALRLVCGELRRIEVPVVTGDRWLPGTVRWQAARNLPPREEITAATADTPALLTFTSGSTGEPKAAVRTHGFLRAQHRVLEEDIALAAGEVDLATLPVFVLANLASGLTSLLPDADLRRLDRLDARAVARQIRRHRPTRTAAAPAFFERLLEMGVPLGGFRKIFVGGAPVFPDLLTRLREAAPEAEVTAVYGSTEAEPMARLDAGEISPELLAAMRVGKGLLAGTPVPSVRLRILADRWGCPLGELTAEEFAASTRAPEEGGEIVVTGDHVLKEYLHGHGDRETKFRVEGETWHRTGDAGRLDRAGRLWLLGRCAARVEDARGRHYPLAVECAARLLGAGRRRCAFVSRGGKRCLFIETSGTLPDGETARLLTALGWAALEEIRCVRHLPVDRRHHSKIDYVALAKVLRRE